LGSPHTPIYWKLCLGAVALVSALTFSPWVLSPNEPGPSLFGVPRTLWAGFAIAVVVVALTFLGARVCPDEETE